MTMRCVAPVILTIVLAASASPARAQQIFIESQSAGEPMMMPPGLGGPRQMKTGTGRILGRVLASDSGTPIRRAQVRLTAPEVGVKTALTDADGRFEFRELPGGRFTLNASKSGYVNVQYGQTRPFEQGRPIELADKQVLDKADISMPRGGVITGRLIDEFGDPRARRDGQRDAADVVERTPSTAADRAHQLRPTISASTGCTACRRASTTSARRCATPTS